MTGNVLTLCIPSYIMNKRIKLIDGSNQNIIELRQNESKSEFDWFTTDNIDPMREDVLLIQFVTMSYNKSTSRGVLLSSICDTVLG